MNKNLRYLWLVVGAALTIFIDGKWNIPLAAWLAPVFFLQFFRKSDKVWLDFVLLWLATAIPASISWHGATFFPPVISFALTFSMAFIKQLIRYVPDRLYYRRFPNSAWVTLVFPIVYTAADFLTTAFSPIGTFSANAYTQRGVLPIMQFASIAGLWGITFVIGRFASLVNYLWDQGFKFNQFALTSACLLLLVPLFGFGRILLKPQPKQTPVIAGFSLPNGALANLMDKSKNEDKADFRRAADQLNTEELNQIHTLAKDGANIVAMQEASFVGMTDQIEQVIQNASTIAKEQKIYIVLPTFDVEKSPKENIVRIIDPKGDIVLTHVKYGGNSIEKTLKGDGILHTVDTPYGRLSAIICWDSEFPNVVRQAGQKQVDLLFLPVNEWREVKDIDKGMSTFRAVENGMTIFRQAGQGISLVVDPYGTEFSPIDAFAGNQTGFTDVQLVKTPIGSVKTLYPNVGDVVGYGMSLGLVSLLIGLFFICKPQISWARLVKVDFSQR